MKVLVTGCAGFIGYHVAEALLARGEAVVGVDNLNDYYDVTLKQARLERLRKQRGFSFHRVDISDRQAVSDLLAESEGVTDIVHLAA
ncbi:MAG TPA: SDR family NAD(P)-dependent oxidoreductase, partial [Rhodopila sp.]